MRHVTLGRSAFWSASRWSSGPARPGGAGRAQAPRGRDHSRSQVAGGGGGRRPRRGGEPHPRDAELPRGRGAAEHDAQAAAGRRRRRERPRSRRVGRHRHRGLEQPARSFAGAAGGSRCRRGIEVLEVPSARVDRSMGDVHPRGNPHFSLDPGLAPAITQNIVDGLARVAPESPRGLRAEPRGLPGPAASSAWPSGRRPWSRCRGARSWSFIRTSSIC